MNAEQFRRIKKSEHSIQLKLFVYRGVDKFNSKTQDVVKLPIGRSTPLVSARPVDIAIPLKSLCNEAAIYWADIYGSEMELSCEISVFHEGGGLRDFTFSSYSCPKWKILCPAK
jgi:hypothetical protein